MTTTNPFTHAVASFEPSSTGVLLWTRLTGGAAADWVVASDPDLRDVVASGTAATDADRDHTIVVDVDGLAPATSYWYRFTVGAEGSPVGRTRTLPAEGARSFRIATVSCARYSVAPLGVYRAVAEREVDLVLHLGDYIYEDDGEHGPRRHDPPHTATTLDDYRRRIAQIRTDPDAQALHLRHPVVTIWDDHDLSDNAWRGGAKKHDPEEHGPWPARVAAAAQARQEWLPGRLRDPDDPLVTWRSLPVGDLAELLLLDTRLVGRDRQAGDDESPDLDDPARSLLGPDQRAWLQARVADVSRPWAVVASGVVVNELELSWPRPLRWLNHLLPNGYAVLDGRILHDDQWDGYPAERQRLSRWLRERGEAGGRALILSGDVHSSWAFLGPCDGENGEPVAVEVTTPAVSSAAMGRAHYPGLWRILDREANDLPHVRWADVTERGYCVVDITPDEVTASWWFVHPYDRRPAARAVPAATFRTERAPWPPRFERVDGAGDDPARDG
ncbi:MAG: alkaline phosphatase D family protein, partial [Acidimicrobiia bacterium]|nr:alkaline phosphatase D family protein [Acidimicrobiia bacterium]